MTSRNPGAMPVQMTEFRVYLGIVLVVALGMALSLWFWGEPLKDDGVVISHDYGSFGRCLRDGMFETVSILTSTGYSNANYQHWPHTALCLILFCMVIGGCTGSTAGGLKILRVVVCARLVSFTLRAFVRPRIVERLKVAGEVIPARVVSGVLGLLLLWIGTAAIGTLVLNLDPRLDLVSSFTASISMMGCIGPAFSEVVQTGPHQFEGVSEISVGPYSGYGEILPGTKVFMSLQMVLGRLELLAPLALLTPSFWRR